MSAPLTKTRNMALVSVVLALVGCARNVDAVKACAAQSAHDNGFQIVGYSGYNYNPISGGEVWYRLKKEPDNGLTYFAGFVAWREKACHLEHIWSPDAVHQ